MPRHLIASLLGFSVAGFLSAMFCVVHPVKAARARERATTRIVPEPQTSTAQASTAPPGVAGALREGVGAAGELVEPKAPAPESMVADDAPALQSLTRRHRDTSGNWVTYEQIPRIASRPVDYDAYRYPVRPGVAGGRHSVISGYDLDLPDGGQRRGSFLNMVGHGGVDLPQNKGEPIKLVALDHQVGTATVLYMGEMFGTTVVTRHARREGGKLRDYLVVYGHLGSVAPGLHVGSRVADGDPVGVVGNTGSPLLVHLHLETRRVRDGVDPRRYEGWHLLGASVVCDPRNVLPLK